MEPLAYSDEGYNLTANPRALPETTRNTICSRLYVEILRQTQDNDTDYVKENASNHAVFKLIFQKPDGEFYGLRLEMTVEYDYGSKPEFIDGKFVQCKSGYLKANPALASTASGRSNWTCELSIRQGWTVDHITGTLIQAGMHVFDFITQGDSYFGCRDFVSQAIFLFRRQHFIESDDISVILAGPKLPLSNIYDALGLHFTHSGEVKVRLIDAGRFRYFPRAKLPEMPYKDSDRAAALGRIVEEVNNPRVDKVCGESV